jgi:hypothetical protein
MQMFIPSVLAALQTLLKGPAWLLHKVIGIFSDWNEPLPPTLPPSYSPSDSPYELHGIPSQQRTYQSQRQISVPSQYATVNQTHNHSQRSPYSPHHQASTLHPTRTASLSPRDAPVATPVNYTQVCPNMLHRMFTQLWNA